MKKMIGLLSVLAIVVMACTTNIGEKDAVLKQNDTETTKPRSNWDRSYGGADKSYDRRLLKLRELIAPKFKTLKFDDKITGRTMTYNLYIPADYDRRKSYPLVLFMADASTTGKGAEAPLKQGYGGIIWATEKSQAKHPCFVLVPTCKGPENAVNDYWETSDEVDMALRLLHSVVSRYSIDKNRLYTTGQSMGGMIAFYLNANHPNLFAASIFVGSQWDIDVLGPLAYMKFFYIVSAADPKASVGMRELGEMLKEKGVTFGTTKFSAKLPDSKQEKDILNLLAEGHSINFVQFTKETVVPTGAQDLGAEHMYSFDYAYKLTAVRDWLFQQTKDTLAKKLYERGIGVKKSYKKAISWYQIAAPTPKEAAKNVHPRVLALVRMGYFYEKGWGASRIPPRLSPGIRLRQKTTMPRPKPPLNAYHQQKGDKGIPPDWIIPKPPLRRKASSQTAVFNQSRDF